jgi:ribosomal-protein-alanine acetyltransferase
MEVHIEQMRPEHLPEVAEVARESFSHPWSWLSLRQAMDSPGSLARVALSEGRVLGYAFAKRVLDEAEILALAVREGVRRRGVGRALAQEVLRVLEASCVRTVRLEVRESNEAARNLYGQLGFRAVFRRAGYYASPREDAVLMKKELRPPAACFPTSAQCP